MLRFLAYSSRYTTRVVHESMKVVVNIILTNIILTFHLSKRTSLLLWIVQHESRQQQALAYHSELLLESLLTTNYIVGLYCHF